MKKNITLILLLSGLMTMIAKADETKLRAGDVLLINIPGTDVRHKTFEADFYGDLLIPIIGKVNIENITVQELQKRISAELPKYIMTIEVVNVSLIHRHKWVEIIGHVKSGGWYKLPDYAGLEEAFSAVGGITYGAQVSQIQLYRDQGRGKRIEVDFLDYRLTGDITLLPSLEHKDLIVVPVSTASKYLAPINEGRDEAKIGVDSQVEQTIRIGGEVRNPGMYKVIVGGNVYDMINLASGITDDADLESVVLLHNNNPDQQTQINLDEILESNDFLNIPEVQPGDMIFVNKKNEKFVLKMWKVIQENIGVVTSISLLYLYWIR